MMQTVQLPSKTIVGLTTRTKNEDEMNLETAAIGSLWQNFFTNVVPTLGETPPPLYGVYTNYESDAMGMFDVVVGAEMAGDVSQYTSVILKKGKYLCFEAKGELPQAVIATWGEIWVYFSDENCTEKRAYETDFELYISKTEAYVYIGIE